MIGGSIDPYEPLNKLSNISSMDGTLMSSLKGMVTCILDSAPSKSNFNSTLSVLGGFLGRRMFMGGGLVWAIEILVETGWFIFLCLVYTRNYFFFNFSLHSWSKSFITSILAFMVSSFIPS
jgi:hypothetical protein